MTEKRFEVKNDYYKGLILVDNLTDEIIEEDIGTGSCYNSCNKLNELAEENEQLKQQLQSRINDYDVALKTLQDLTERKLKENEQLKSEYKVLHTQHRDLQKFVENNFDEHLTQQKLTRQIIKLSDENEQLKKELFEARKDYLIETADISDKLYLDEMIEKERKEIFYG